jgi:hypothetical protein
MEEKRNYWKEEEELLLKDWADKAQCYELLHSKSHGVYKQRHAYFVIPVIIISTLTGTANFAQDKISDERDKNIFVMVTGGLNICAAIVSTIGQFLKISEMNEGHRVASYSWGKYYRHLKTELAKHPLDRINPKDLIAMAKEDYDRLLELSPMIPKKIIKQFNMTFLENDEISKPEICDIITPTTIYSMSKDKRESMINKLNPQPIIEENIEESEEEVIEEKKVNPLIEKFNQSFFKIHLRYPTDEEVKASLGSLYHEDDNNEHTVININDTFA